jgi:hypothetical protein
VRRVILSDRRLGKRLHTFVSRRVHPVRRVTTPSDGIGSVSEAISRDTRYDGSSLSLYDLPNGTGNNLVMACACTKKY